MNVRTVLGLTNLLDVMKCNHSVLLHQFLYQGLSRHFEQDQTASCRILRNRSDIQNIVCSLGLV